MTVMHIPSCALHQNINATQDSVCVYFVYVHMLFPLVDITTACAAQGSAQQWTAIAVCFFPSCMSSIWCRSHEKLFHFNFGPMAEHHHCSPPLCGKRHTRLLQDGLGDLHVALTRAPHEHNQLEGGGVCVCCRVNVLSCECVVV